MSHLQINLEPSLALAAAIQAGETLLESDAHPPTNLPAALCPLIGRERELEDVARLLADPACRLLTIVGPGGSGKTRLALQAAAAALPGFAGGVFVVNLEEAGGRDDLAPALAQVLGLSLAGEQELWPQLVAALGGKQTLLVLDNFEQITTAVPLLIDLLQAAPAVKLLVTSRVRLNVQAEHVYTIGGLGYPERGVRLAMLDDAQSGEDAVTLFLYAARCVRPDFAPTAGDLTTIGEICRTVEGLPLAVLLAAAWVDVLTPLEISVRLARGQAGLALLQAVWADVPARQHSMSAVFDHSWRLLPEADQRLAARLSVFRGGFTATAAQIVTDAGLPDLRRLADCTLLQLEASGRFAMPELQRRYAAACLAALPQVELAALRRHREYFCTALHAWDKVAREEHGAPAMREIETELGNLTAAWEDAAGANDLAALELAVDGLCGFYSQRGRLREGLAAVREAAAVLKPTSPRARCVLARLLTWQAVFERLLGEQETARDHLQAALAWLQAPDVAVTCDTRGLLALVLYESGWLKMETDPAGGRLAWVQALSLARAVGDEWLEVRVLEALTGLTYDSAQE